MPNAHVTSLIIYLLFVVAGLAALSYYYERYRLEKKLSAAVIFSSFWAIVAGGLILWIMTVGYRSLDEFVQSFLASLGGAALGWLLGMYISPIGTSEATAFQKYGTALAGVLSGYTLKSAIDFAMNHRTLLRAHWLPLELFAICTVLSVGAVYNSRAYDNKLLEVHVKGDNPTLINGAVQLAPSATAAFYAKVIGPGDPAVAWDVFPVNPAKYTIDRDTGILTTLASASSCKLIATNLEDPSLSNFLKFDIT